MLLNEDDDELAHAYVRMVGAETHDFTYSDNDDDWITFKEPNKKDLDAYLMDFVELANDGKEERGLRP